MDIKETLLDEAVDRYERAIAEIYGQRSSIAVDGYLAAAVIKARSAIANYGPDGPEIKDVPKTLRRQEDHEIQAAYASAHQINLDILRAFRAGIPA